MYKRLYILDNIYNIYVLLLQESVIRNAEDADTFDTHSDSDGDFRISDSVNINH